MKFKYIPRPGSQNVLSCKYVKNLHKHLTGFNFQSYYSIPNIYNIQGRQSYCPLPNIYNIQGRQSYYSKPNIYNIQGRQISLLILHVPWTASNYTYISEYITTNRRTCRVCIVQTDVHVEYILYKQMYM